MRTGSDNKEVRKVQKDGGISFNGKEIKIGKAFAGYPVAIRQTDKEAVVDIYFCQKKIKEITICMMDKHGSL